MKRIQRLIEGYLVADFQRRYGWSQDQGYAFLESLSAMPFWKALRTALRA